MGCRLGMVDEMIIVVNMINDCLVVVEFIICIDVMVWLMVVFGVSNDEIMIV